MPSDVLIVAPMSLPFSAAGLHSVIPSTENCQSISHGGKSDGLNSHAVDFLKALKQLCNEWLPVGALPSCLMPQPCQAAHTDQIPASVQEKVQGLFAAMPTWGSAGFHALDPNGTVTPTAMHPLTGTLAQLSQHQRTPSLRSAPHVSITDIVARQPAESSAPAVEIKSTPGAQETPQVPTHAQAPPFQPPCSAESTAPAESGCLWQASGTENGEAAGNVAIQSTPPAYLQQVDGQTTECQRENMLSTAGLSTQQHQMSVVSNASPGGPVNGAALEAALQGTAAPDILPATGKAHGSADTTAALTHVVMTSSRPPDMDFGVSAKATQSSGTAAQGIDTNAAVMQSAQSDNEQSLPRQSAQDQSPGPYLDKNNASDIKPGDTTLFFQSLEGKNSTAESPASVAAQRLSTSDGEATGSRIVCTDSELKEGLLLSNHNPPETKAAESQGPAQDFEIHAKDFRNQTFNQIVQKAVLHLNDGRNEVRLDLKPEFLGHIRMQIITENQQVTLRILTELPVVKELIENNFHQLKTELHHQGLVIDKLDVSVDHDLHQHVGHQYKAVKAKIQQPTDVSQATAEGSSEVLSALPNRAGQNETYARIDFFV